MKEIKETLLNELFKASHGNITTQEFSDDLKIEELGINSMALITILFGLEESTGIDITELGDDLEAPETIGGLLKIVDKLLSVNA